MVDYCFLNLIDCKVTYFLFKNKQFQTKLCLIVNNLSVIRNKTVKL